MIENTAQKGFTVLEILIVIAIGAFLVSATFSSFFSLSKREVLRGEAFQVVSVLSRARSLTLSSKGDVQYGVHLGANEVVLFSGPTYVAGNSANQVIPLHPAVTISATTLTGGGSDIVFDRLTGSTSQYGTTTVSLIANPSEHKAIVVYPTGIAEMQ